jgi:hypothetical protein
MTKKQNTNLCLALIGAVALVVLGGAIGSVALAAIGSIAVALVVLRHDQLVDRAIEEADKAASSEWRRKVHPPLRED